MMRLGVAESWMEREMDHENIENDHVADLYLQGKLTPEEADRFEEHYLSCQECLDRLGRAERLARGFKRAAAEDAARLAAVRQAGFFAALARLGRSRQAGLAVAALFMVLLLPGILAYRELGRLGQELDRTREALAREQEKPAPAAPSTPTVVEDRAALERAQRAEAERQRLEGELERERSARAGLEKDLAQARQPQTNTPILSLSPERSAGGAEPTHQIRLPATPGWIVLSLELDAPEFETYQVTLLRAGQEIWRGNGLEPNETDSLSVSLPTALLNPGDYVVRVEGAPAGGRPGPVAQFTFRALKG
jgi:hypothetical protein